MADDMSTTAPPSSSRQTSDEAKESRLAALHLRRLAVMEELESVDAAIKAEESTGGEVEEALEGKMMHRRPSWSFFGGLDDEPPTLRDLQAEDEDFTGVLKDHPELKIDPIGAFNHWDRRECAVPEYCASQWRERCRKHIQELGGTANIPKVIHQIWVGPKEPPCLWIDTFRVEYLRANPEWGFTLWSDTQVAELPMFNRHLYMEEKLWQCKADILRLEFLWHHGGVYVDADMVSVEQKSLDPLIEMGKQTGFVIAYEPDTKDKPYSILGNSVIACTPHHPLILMLILYLKQTYPHKRNVIEVFAVTGPVMYTKCLVDCNMPISIAPQELLYPAFHYVPNPDAINFSSFPKCLMFQFGYTCSGLEGYVKRKNRCMCPRTCSFHMHCSLLESYRRLPHACEKTFYGQVPISLSYLKEWVENPSTKLPMEDSVLTFVFDGELMQLEDLRGKLPQLLDNIRFHNPWDLMFFGIEWSTGSDEVVVFHVPQGGRPRNAMILGLFINVRSPKVQILRSVLKGCISDKGFDPTSLFNVAGRLDLWMIAQKFSGTVDEARMWRSMPVVHKIFTTIANHDPPLHFDDKEMHGNLMKGKLHGRMAFEMIVEGTGGITFRSWNDDNSTNCEMKSTTTKVEWMKVFYHNQIVFEARGRDLP